MDLRSTAQELEGLDAKELQDGLDFLEQQVQGMLREKGSSPSRALVIKQSGSELDMSPSHHLYVAVPR